MDIRHLRYFLAIAEAGSVTEAARRVCVSQPSLTRQLRDLENHLDCKLFLRTKRGVHLTKAGTTLLLEAHKAVAQFETALRRTRDTGHRAQRLTLGMIPGTEDELIIRAQAVLRRHITNLELEVQSMVPPDLVKALDSGAIEAAFIRRGDVGAQWATREVRTETLVAILPTHHRLARKRRITPADFHNESIVVVAPTAAPALRTAVDRFLSSGSRSPIAPWQETNTMLSLFSIMAATGACSLVPGHFARMLPKGIVARTASEACEPDLSLVLAYAAERVSPALQLLIQEYP